MGTSDASDDLKSLLAASELEPYIRHIRFPFFRNLQPALQINFEYPITALVGANGTSKSSILRALQGCPDQHNIGKYWFSTDLDQIVSGKNRHQFVHGYFSTGYGQVVESLKIRITARGPRSAKSRKDPDYFEPQRPTLVAGMDTKMPDEAIYPSHSPDRVETRWKAITKNVEYLDFRTDLSAFDKYFYHGAYAGESSAQERKDSIRRWAARLALSLRYKRTGDVYFGKERIAEGPHQATSVELEWISTILGKRYKSVTYLKHNYFHPPGLSNGGWTVHMKTDNLTYSEAFAGSGEYSVAMAVFVVSRSPDRSLLIFDEPEVSLHPESQKNLMEFLRDHVKQGKHQVVLATHSPEIIRGLPPEAIKVLALDPLTDRVILTAQSTHANDAFIRLGVPPKTGLRILVEDELAAEILNRSLRTLSDEARQRISVQPMGGAASLLQQIIPTLSKFHDSATAVWLDGDQRRVSPLPESGTVPSAKYESILKSICDGAPKLLTDGGAGAGNADKMESARADMIDWMHKYLNYLPGSGPPEELLLVLEDADDPEAPEAGSRASKYKKYWVERARAELDTAKSSRPTSADIFFVQKAALAKVPTQHPLLASIADAVEKHLRKLDD